MNFNPADWSRLNRKERAIYSCIVIGWGFAVLITAFIVGIGVAFVCGLISGYYKLSDENWVVLIPVIAMLGTGASVLLYDHRSNFIQRSALAVIEYIKEKHDGT